MTGLGSPLRDVRAAALVVGLVAVLVYANSLWNQFAYDDVHIVLENDNLQSLETLPRALVTPYWPKEFGRELGLWRPVTTGVLGLLRVASGESAVPFHLVIVLAHAATSVLTLLVLSALMPLLPSFLAALVFAVHPVHVEAVANVVGLAEVLSALGILAACLVHVRGPTTSSWGRSLAIGALYAIALGAKESGVTLPGLVFLVDAARRQIAFRDLASYVRERWRLYLVMALVAASLLAGRFAILGSIAQPLPPLGADLLTDLPRIWTLGEVWTHYVRLWVFPLDLSSDYSPNVLPISFTWHSTNLVGVVLALCVLVMTLITWRRPDMRPDTATSKAAAFGVVWFMVAISSTSNTLFLAGVMLAERTLYLPSVGLAAATGWLAVRLARERPRLVWAALVVALVAGSVRTWTRNPTWKDNQSVFTTMLADVPQSGRSQWILGDRFIAAGNLSQGLVSYRAALNILGGHYTLVTEIAQKLMDMGRYQAAERLLTFAWRDSPHLAVAPSQIAWIRAIHGDAAGTDLWARRSLEIYETDAARWHVLAWSLAARGAWDEAVEARRRAEELGQAHFWHDWMYRAYQRREDGDSVGALQAVDSAWASATDPEGRIAIDSVRVEVFGLEPLLGATSEPEPGH